MDRQTRTRCSMRNKGKWRWIFMRIRALWWVLFFFSVHFMGWMSRALSLLIDKLIVIEGRLDSFEGVQGSKRTSENRECLTRYILGEWFIKYEWREMRKKKQVWNGWMLFNVSHLLDKGYFRIRIYKDRVCLFKLFIISYICGTKCWASTKHSPGTQKKKRITWKKNLPPYIKLQWSFFFFFSCALFTGAHS